MAKRLMCIIISVLMIVSLLPTGVIADSDASKTDSSVASLTIGDTTTYYDTVTAAITAAGTSEATVAVFGEGISTAITVTSGQNISLDFQTDYYGNISVASGGVLTLNSTWGTGGNATVDGTLNVVNGSINGTVTVNGSMTISGGSVLNVVLSSGATLEITGGSVQSSITSNGGTVTVSGGTISDSITINSGSLTFSGGTISENLTVNGGSVSITGGTVGGTGVVTVSGGTLNVSGGTINDNVVVSDGTLTVSDSANLKGGITLTGSGSVTVSGGTVSISGSAEETAITVSSGATGTVSITGGSITTKSDHSTTAITVSSDEATISITGGTFSSDVTSYVTGTVTKNEDGTYTVTSTSTSVAKNVTTTTSYETLQAAIDAASSGDVIQLLADVTENITIAADDNVTIDLNGHTITSKPVPDEYDLDPVYYPVVSVKGTLILKDSSTEQTGAVYMCSYTDAYNSVYTYTGKEGGAVYVYSGGRFTLTSGTLKGDGVAMSGVDGGGVYVESGATFTMNGGTITNFKVDGSSADGAGVYNAGTFIMNDGTITGNSSGYDDAGGVYNAGTFTMNGGSISNNSCHDFGAGVLNGTYGVFTMTAGSITGNSVTSSDGGTSGVYNAGTFKMSGGSITDNTDYNSNIYDCGGVHNDGTIELSGNPVIDNNTLGNGTECNLVLYNSSCITLTSALTSGASIGVSTNAEITEGTQIQITTTESDTDYYSSSLSYFSSDNTSYSITANSNGYLQIGIEAKTYVAAVYDSTGVDSDVNYTSVSEAIENAKYSYQGVKLLMNVEEDITISADDDIVLDLAGYTLTGDVTVNGGTLEIKDSVGNGTIKGDVSALCVVETDYSSATVTYWDGSSYQTISYSDWLNTSYYSEGMSGIVYVQSTAALTLTSGTISGEVYVYGSSYTMNGGQSGRVVLKYADSEDFYDTTAYVYTGSTKYSEFTMNAGTITGGSASTSSTSAYKGGGVCVGDYCTFTMTGGTITSNTAGASAASGSTSIGGGVYVGRNATFTMSDGTISNNSAVLGGGVAVAGSGAKFTMNSGTITGNSVSEYTSGGGGVYVGDGATFEMTSGTISNNSTTIYTVPETEVDGYQDNSYVTGEYSGGGVAISNGTFTMSGGVITGNSSTYGGGVAIGTCSYDSHYSTYTGTFTMTGGAIYGNTANIAGADIYALSASDSGVSGGTLSLTLKAASDMTATGEDFTSYCWFADTSDSRYDSDSNITDKVSVDAAITTTAALIAADSTFNLGISSDDTKTVEAEIASGYGTSVLYVKVTSENISSYSESAYPTTSLTFGDDNTGYIFAGWYSYDSDSQSYTALTEFPEDTDAYAKFVDANVLTVKVQLTKDTTSESNSTDMRLVSTVDSLDYSCVGFEIYITKTTMTETNKVYESIVGSDGESVLSYTATDFSSSSSYLHTYIITSISKANFDTSIKVRAYWKTADGTIVYGEQRDLTVNKVLNNTSD